LNCELCSIVSSSGQMLGQAAGTQIDRSPCIWRMNNAPTRGFENDVGQRTTLRVVSHTSVPLLLQKPHHFFGQGNDTVYVVWGPLRNMRKDGKGIVYNMLRQASQNYPHARIYVTTEDRMNYSHDVPLCLLIRLRESQGNDCGNVAAGMLLFRTNLISSTRCCSFPQSSALLALLAVPHVIKTSLNFLRGLTCLVIGVASISFQLHCVVLMQDASTDTEFHVQHPSSSAAQLCRRPREHSQRYWIRHGGSGREISLWDIMLLRKMQGVNQC
ncbi:hypothetical protein XENOCAPTIV_022379, partial [Xenoophorus captivus]